MNNPCPNPVNCPGVDLPVVNTTAEAADVFLTFGYTFRRNSSSVCQSTDPNIVNTCDPGVGTTHNPPPPQVFSSNEKICITTCADNTTRTYVVAAGAFMAMSQADADQLAQRMACRGADALCLGDEVQTFTNVQQSCSYACPDGSSQSITVPAGTFSGLSQEEADTAAYDFACLLATLVCGGGPPGPGGSGGGSDTTSDEVTGGGIPGSTGGAGDPPPPGQVIYNNAPQTCSETCGDQTFSYTTPAATFRNTSILAANAAALSYACNRVQAMLKCLSDITNLHVCTGESYTATVQQVGVGSAAEVNWSATDLPPGITFLDGVFSGTPTTGGTYPVTVQALNAFTAASAVRVYTFVIQQITTEDLGPATENSAYSQAVAATGTFGVESWSASGLPSGLAINSVTGVIAGTPTEDGIFLVTVSITSDGVTCSKEFSLDVAPSSSLVPVLYYKFEEASGDRVDSVSGKLIVPTETGGGVLNRIAGVRDFAAQCFTASASVREAALEQATIADGFIYTGTPLTLTGWFKYDGIFPVDFVGFSQIIFGLDWGGDVNAKWQVYTEPFADQMKLNGGSGVTVLLATPSQAAWHFYVIEYNLVTNELSIEIDRNGIIYTVTPSEVPIVGDALNFFVTSKNQNRPVDTYVATDETGLFDFLLSDAEKDLLYGSGTPPAYPFV